MSDRDSLAWGTVTPRKHLHDYRRVDTYADGALVESNYQCTRCGRVRDEAIAKQNKNNKARGNDIERWVCKLLGIERRGQYGGLDDGGGSTDFIVVQVKSGGAFTEGRLAKIHTIPVNADQLRGWVTVSTPGAGHQREGVISFDLKEFAAWYGRGSGEDAA